MVPGDVIGKIGAALIVQEATERDAVLVTWVHSLCGSSSFETCAFVREHASSFRAICAAEGGADVGTR